LADKDFPIRTEALDHFHLSDIGFIKLDGAGCEDVLAGASRTILGRQPRVQIDFDGEDMLRTVARVAGWFRRLEYRGYFIHDRAILAIDRFSESLMQGQPDDRGPCAAAPAPSRRSVGHFFFLPPNEPEETLPSVAAHLART